MTNSERAAYIRGLMEGLEIDDSTKEGKVLNAIVELLDEMCLSIDELEDTYDELQDQVDEIDEDLGTLEEDFYDMDDEDYDDSDDEDYDDDGFDDDDCYFEVTCPNCGDNIELNGAMLDEGSLVCPGCGQTLEFDLDEIEDEEECGDTCGCGSSCEG